MKDRELDEKELLKAAKREIEGARKKIMKSKIREDLQTDLAASLIIISIQLTKLLKTKKGDK